ncbi:hypothetical protein [Leptolyngbya sp. FACHB-711]|uniref:hypothetical protein n=1 Tax=Leptolyngbya sp. FACHB-711 TaxID=2692813 RepID=UPI0016893223|nr:hypothetical protein [Leptolyngbya sp. FACHB-711]MBD2024193.1 hypothetical protein [Leptolyngbya sp. FACHB-711]
MAYKTLEANSIPIPPQLAGLLKQTLGKSGTGFDESAFLQQLHYWTVNSAVSGWVADGIKWVYNSLKSWQEQFPWMTQYGLRKAIANLKKLGLIQTAQHWITSYKRVMFYRIDYDRLSAFAGTVCDLVTLRCANSDPIDVLNNRTTDTETSSDNSLSEQQTAFVVVSQMNEEETGSAETGKAAGGEQGSGVEVDSAMEGTLSPASSGEVVEIQSAEFPELAEEVAEAIGYPPNTPLPTALKEAIERFPDRVKPAIAYLRQQQQKRQIKNPMGYLYEAIVKGWNVQIEKHSILPKGFNEWFDYMKRQGLVIAATTIDGIHHTLHIQQGWIPTMEAMRKYSMAAANH